MWRLVAVFTKEGDAVFADFVVVVLCLQARAAIGLWFFLRWLRYWLRWRGIHDYLFLTLDLNWSGLHSFLVMILLRLEFDRYLINLQILLMCILILKTQGPDIRVIHNIISQFYISAILPSLSFLATMICPVELRMVMIKSDNI